MCRDSLETLALYKSFTYLLVIIIIIIIIITATTTAAAADFILGFWLV